MLLNVNVTPVQNMHTYPICKKCKQGLHLRIPRGVLIKTFLFWLPMKKYFCTNCLRKRYVIVKNN